LGSRLEVPRLRPGRAYRHLLIQTDPGAAGVAPREGHPSRAPNNSEAIRSRGIAATVHADERDVRPDLIVGGWRVQQALCPFPFRPVIRTVESVAATLIAPRKAQPANGGDVSHNLLQTWRPDPLHLVEPGSPCRAVPLKSSNSSTADSRGRLFFKMFGPIPETGGVKSLSLVARMKSKTIFMAGANTHVPFGVMDTIVCPELVASRAARPELSYVLKRWRTTSRSPTP